MANLRALLDNKDVRDVFAASLKTSSIDEEQQAPPVQKKPVAKPQSDEEEETQDGQPEMKVEDHPLGHVIKKMYPADGEDPTNPDAPLVEHKGNGVVPKRHIPEHHNVLDQAGYSYKGTDRVQGHHYHVYSRGGKPATRRYRAIVRDDGAWVGSGPGVPDTPGLTSDELGQYLQSRKNMLTTPQDLEYEQQRQMLKGRREKAQYGGGGAGNQGAMQQKMGTQGNGNMPGGKPPGGGKAPGGKPPVRM